MTPQPHNRNDEATSDLNHDQNIAVYRDAHNATPHYDTVHGSNSEDPSPFDQNILHRSTSRASRSVRNDRRASRPSVDYDAPEAYRNLDDVYIEPPVQNPDDEEQVRHSLTLEDSRELSGHSRHGSGSGSGSSTRGRSRRLSQGSLERDARNARRRSMNANVVYDVPDAFANLDELAAGSIVENPDEEAIYEHGSLEQTRSREQEYQREASRASRGRPEGAEESPMQEKPPEEPETPLRVSRLATQIYTISYLILFSFFGTLARLGLQALTTYPGTPAIFTSLWPNFGGSLVMGFLAEDRMLFRSEWGTPTYDREIRRAKENGQVEESAGSGSETPAVDLTAAKKAYMATKKTIPLYIGLATGFCGSFTSFSAFIRDIFFALSNDLTTPGLTSPAPRNGGYSFMALLAVILITVSLCLSGLFIGAHIAITLEPITPSLPYLFTRKIADRLAVFLAGGCWLGAILLSIFPPDRFGGGKEVWRGRATFSLVFAPLGCLARFYASLYLNGRIASFPLGTFAVNIFGTAILGMSWDLAHVPLGGVVGCQVLQGIEDGFCGCLTTVSTWVAELAALRRRHAYFYGAMSVVSGLAILVAIMGGLRWSDGFAALECTH